MKIKVKVKKIVETEEERILDLPNMERLWEEIIRKHQDNIGCLVDILGISSASCKGISCSYCVFEQRNAKYIK